MTNTGRLPISVRRVSAPLAWTVLASLVFLVGSALAAGATPGGMEVEIKKHTTGKEATVRHGDKEWFIHIDVDQDRTMILRTETTKGRETGSSPEIVDRPMTNTEVDKIIADLDRKSVV